MMSDTVERDPPLKTEDSAPVIDREMMAIARIEAIFAEFNEIGQRRRMFQYLLDKMGCTL